MVRMIAKKPVGFKDMSALNQPWGLEEKPGQDDITRIEVLVFGDGRMLSEQPARSETVTITN